ncbi:MAG: hypothetical protein CMK59_12030 [Proteobacteria bacterium]|nr:hypothetical protein [Pseudomonadota bacterium]
MNNFNELLVVAGVFFSKNKVLVALRPLNKSSGGLWEFPGGKVDDGESPKEALIRELFEELNVRVSVLNFIAQSRAEVNNRRIKMLLFEVRLDSGTLFPKEHEEIRWVTPEELGLLKWAPLDIPLIKSVHSLLIKRSSNTKLV